MEKGERDPHPSLGSRTPQCHRTIPRGQKLSTGQLYGDPDLRRGAEESSQGCPACASKGEQSPEVSKEPAWKLASHLLVQSCWEQNPRPPEETVSHLWQPVLLFS